MPNMIRMLPTIALLAVALNGCATTVSPVKTDPEAFCLIAHPITLGPHDVLSDKTADEIRSHDQYGYDHCGWDKR